MLTIDQIVSAPKAQIAAFNHLGNKALDSAEQLTELNLKTGKAVLAESAAYVQDLLSVKSPQDVLALYTGAVQPLAEKVAAYSRELYNIASGASAEFGKVANSQAADAQQQFVAAVDSALKNAPQGSEAAVAAVKNAVSTASAAIETVQKAVKQATELTEANINALAETAPKVAPKTKA
ncbi:MAG: hypothetical protein RJA36_346 [Pseudomonadota bacterium]|jgi:phasin family protein